MPNQEREAMKKLRFSRYYLLLGLPLLLALVGLVWGRSLTSSKAVFDADDFCGRYISAEVGNDISSFNPVSTGAYVTPVPFAATAVMISDGKGDVCGESDGFYGGLPYPGVNTGPGYFHGTYTVGGIDGRIVITTCSDTGFCATKGACDTTGKFVYRTLVGYLQSNNGNKVTTVDQINGSDCSKGGTNPGCASTGYLVHARVWTKDATGETHEQPF
jgi:hypothetical protein